MSNEIVTVYQPVYNVIVSTPGPQGADGGGGGGGGSVTLTGAVTGTGTGTVATSLGSFTSAQLRSALSDEVGTGAAYFVGGDLGTPAGATLTNATGLPVASGISGLASGVATFLGTPTSANLRAALTDESGTGAAYFQGGDLGTPSAGVLTNATGYTFANVASKPTTISGYGITDAVSKSPATEAANTITAAAGLAGLVLKQAAAEDPALKVNDASNANLITLSNEVGLSFSDGTSYAPASIALASTGRSYGIVPPGTGTGSTTLTLPSAAPTNGYFLQTDGSGNLTWAAGGSGSPGGSTTQVQFNNAGAFGGSALLTWDAGADTLTVTGTITADITNGGVIGGSSITSTGIVRGVSVFSNYTTTATAGGTTTLTASSTQQQNFTGTLDQNVDLPSTAGLTVGQSFEITNEGTGTLTIRNSAATVLTQVFAGGQVVCTVQSTGAQTWREVHYGSDVQTFLAGGTWTKRPGLKYAQAYVFAPGGGGSGGSRGDTSVARVGGGGGASGGVSSRFYRASELGGTENVTIGAFGAAGTAQAGTGNGGAGGTGGTTEFGTSTTLCRAIGGGGGSATGGAGATAQGTITTGQGGVASSGTGAAGTNGTLNFAGGVVIGSGASGGGITTGGAASAGGHRSSASLFMPLYGLTASTGAGTSGGGAGSAGANAVGFFGGVGGGGGGSSVTASVAGGAGGAGGFPGGGGGGGGAAGSTAGSSGVGGAGGAGVIYVICYF